MPIAGAAGASPWALAPGEFFTRVDGSYGTSKSFFDADGERPPFAAGGSYDRRELRWATELGWKKRLSFRADLPFVNVSRAFAPSVGSTATSLSDLEVGLKYRLIGGATALALSADIRTPMGYNRRLTPAVGDGRQDAIGMLELGMELRPIHAFLQLGGGYLRRLDSYNSKAAEADEALATADFGWWVSRHVLLAGDYRGRFESHDTLTPGTEHLIGPQILYRVDDGLDVFAGSQHTASGKNVLHFDRYYIGVAAKKTTLGRLQGFFGNSK